jgi:hypothetical protein
VNRIGRRIILWMLLIAAAFAMIWNVLGGQTCPAR